MRIGLIGVGTVGGGVVEILESKSDFYKESLGLNIELALVCARSDEELAPFKEKGYPVTTDAMALIQDPSIEVLVELAGGYELPKKWIQAALEQGKHVVTANKALLAKYGHELFPLAKEKGVHILFEAAVGGGIPIIRSLQEAFVGNEVQSLSCIINGTANYILTRMSQEGLSFQEALQEAQEKGYAEADPTFDIEGIDAAHKTALLASLSSRTYVDFEKIYVSGISSLTSADIAFAKDLDCSIKLLGIYNKVEDQIDVRVHPCLVSNDHLLSSVNGVLNAVFLECDNLGPTLQTGAGAGKLPTASAVVADLVALSRYASKLPPIPMDFFQKETKANLLPISETKTRYYFRFTTQDSYGVLANITRVLAESRISIESIIQKGVQDPGKVSIVVITEKTIESRVNAAIEKIDALESVSDKSQVIRFLM